MASSNYCDLTIASCNDGNVLKREKVSIVGSPGADIYIDNNFVISTNQATHSLYEWDTSQISGSHSIYQCENQYQNDQSCVQEWVPNIVTETAQVWVTEYQCYQEDDDGNCLDWSDGYYETITVEVDRGYYNTVCTDNPTTNYICTNPIFVSIETSKGSEYVYEKDYNTVLSTPRLVIQAFYIGYFARGADSAGIDYWSQQYSSGMSLHSIAASFSVQTESRLTYPFLANPSLATIDSFISQVYQNLFNRAPDSAGLQYWRNQLASNIGSPQAISSFILQVIYGALGADRDSIVNKIAVADFISKHLESQGIRNFGGSDTSSNLYNKIKNTINNTTSSSDSVQIQVEAFVRN